MKEDKFFVVSTTDRLAKILMLVSAGIILGAVIIRIYFDLLNPVIDCVLGILALYCVFFTFYMFFTGLKKNATHIAIFKDYLSIVLTKRDELPTRCDIAFSDIKSYKIAPNTNAKNAKRENPNTNEYSLRAYGYKTTIETHSGETYEFSDSKKDGVLVYSPGYVYRMIDLQRFKPDFNLDISEFNCKADIEGFGKQFEYYKEKEKALSIFKNKKYKISLLLLTLVVAIVAMIISFFVAMATLQATGNIDEAYIMIWYLLKTFLAIVVPMWCLAFTVTIYGSKRNEAARKAIKSILEA